MFRPGGETKRSKIDLRSGTSFWSHMAKLCFNKELGHSYVTSIILGLEECFLIMDAKFVVGVVTNLILKS